MINIKSNKKALILVVLFLVTFLALLLFLNFRKGSFNMLSIRKENKNYNIARKDVVFAKLVNDRFHLIYGGEDLGEIASDNFEVFDGKLVFEKEVNGVRHIVFDGKDVGAGFHPLLSGSNLAFYRDVENSPHLIFNDEDLGDVYIKDNHFAVISGGNIAYEKKIDGTVHIIYNGKDMGQGRNAALSKSGQSIAFLREIDGMDHIIYKGEILGLSSSSFSMDDNYVCYSSPASSLSFSDKIKEPLVSRNKEEIGNGYGVECSGENYLYRRGVNGEQHVIFSGKDYGGIAPEKEMGIAKNNFFFMRLNEAGETVVVYNGKELGVGSDPVIGDEGFAYVKMVDGKSHVIYNEKDLGEGVKPIISADGKNVAFVREVDGKKHVFVGADDLGEIGGDELVLKFSN